MVPQTEAKLDPVAPLITDPPPTSFTTLSHKIKCHLTCDMSHVTHDMSIVTHDMRHVTDDRWGI